MSCSLPRSCRWSQSCNTIVNPPNDCWQKRSPYDCEADNSTCSWMAFPYGGPGGNNYDEYSGGPQSPQPSNTSTRSPQGAPVAPRAAPFPQNNVAMAPTLAKAPAPGPQPQAWAPLPGGPSPAAPKQAPALPPAPLPAAPILAPALPPAPFPATPIFAPALPPAPLPAAPVPAPDLAPAPLPSAPSPAPESPPASPVSETTPSPSPSPTPGTPVPEPTSPDLPSPDLPSPDLPSPDPPSPDPPSPDPPSPDPPRPTTPRPTPLARRPLARPPLARPPFARPPSPDPPSPDPPSPDPTSPDPPSPDPPSPDHPSPDPPSPNPPSPDPPSPDLPSPDAPSPDPHSPDPPSPDSPSPDPPSPDPPSPDPPSLEPPSPGPPPPDPPVDETPTRRRLLSVAASSPSPVSSPSPSPTPDPTPFPSPAGEWVPAGSSGDSLPAPGSSSGSDSGSVPSVPGVSTPGPYNGTYNSSTSYSPGAYYSTATSAQNGYDATAAQNGQNYGPSGMCVTRAQAHCSALSQDQVACARDPICTPNTRCDVQTCYEGDSYCRAAQAQAPLCQSLVKVIGAAVSVNPPELNTLNALPLKVCTGLGLCKAPTDSSSVCTFCKTSGQRMITPLLADAWLGNTFVPRNAFEQCKITIGQISSNVDNCKGISQSLDIRDANAFQNTTDLCLRAGGRACDTRPGPNNSTVVDCTGCAAYLDIFGTLSAAGIYKRDADSLSGFCLFISSQSQQSNGNELDSIRSAIQGKFACASASSDSCCIATSNTSVLSSMLSIASVRPQNEACSALPGCGYQASCVLNDDADGCQRFTVAGGAAVCSNSPGCQWTPRYDLGWPLGGVCRNATLDRTCKAQGANATACGRVVDPMTNTPLCAVRRDCRDACRDCRDCISSVSSLFTPIYNNLQGTANANLIPQKLGDICRLQGTIPSDVCQKLQDSALVDPTFAARPAAICSLVIPSPFTAQDEAQCLALISPLQEGHLSFLCHQKFAELPFVQCLFHMCMRIPSSSDPSKGSCSNCRDTMKLDLCSATGYAAPAPPPPAPSAVSVQAVANQACQKDTDCSAGSVCELDQTSTVAVCDPATGRSSVAFASKCVLYCSSSKALALMSSFSGRYRGFNVWKVIPLFSQHQLPSNATKCLVEQKIESDGVSSLGIGSGACSGADASCGEGKICKPSRSCYTATCSASTNRIINTPCYGYCGVCPMCLIVDASASALSATFSQDASSIFIRLSAPSMLLSADPRGMFDEASARLLKSSSLFFQGSDFQTLWIALDPANSVVPGSALVIRQDPSRPVLLDTAFGSPFLDGTIPGGVQANTSATPPTAVIAGPTSLPASCSSTSSGFGVLFDGSQSQKYSSKPLTRYAWATTSSNADLLADIALANGRTSPQKQAYLVLSATTASALPANSYTISLQVKDWLNTTASTTWTFSKSAAPAPLIDIVGGGQHSFLISQGINVNARIRQETVCPGSKVQYTWAFAESSPTFTSPFTASSKNLVVGTSMGVVGAVPGLTYTFVLTAQLLGTDGTPKEGQSSTASVALTAIADPVVAVLVGPRGDVLPTSDLLFTSASIDPTDASTLPANQPSIEQVPFQYSWTCVQYDSTRTVSSPCFSDGNSWSLDAAGNAVIPAGILQANDSTIYVINMKASKIIGDNTRSDDDYAIIRVREVSAGTPPYGNATRSCLPLGTCPKKQSSTSPVRLVFSAPPSFTNLAYSWYCASPASGCPNLSAPGVSNGRTSAFVVINPYDASGNPTLPDGVTLTFAVNLTDSRTGLTGQASVDVPINRRPVCTASPQSLCLTSDKSTGTALNTSFTVTANSWASSDTLVYEFGRVDTTGKRTPFVKNSLSNTYTFLGLPQGNQTLYVCVSDTLLSQVCATTTVEVTAIPADFKPNFSALADSLTTANNSGDPQASIAASQQLATTLLSLGSATSSPEEKVESPSPFCGSPCMYGVSAVGKWNETHLI
eukprot:jgi/Botrbrau1/21183/Bobra.0061s0074.1